MKMNFAKKATALAMSVLFAVSMAGCGSSASTAKKVEVTSVEDLADLKIGVQTGTTGDSQASDAVNADSQMQRYNKGADAIQALKNGKIDCVVIDSLPAEKFVAANDDLKIVEGIFDTEEYAMCFKKGNELRDEFNTALAELKEDGTLDEIMSNYIGDEVGQHPYEGRENFETSSSTCKVRFEYYQDKKEKEPLFQTNGASYSWLYQAGRLNRYLQRKAWKQIQSPVLIFQSAEDHLVSKPEQVRFVVKLARRGLTSGTMIIVPGTKHEIYGSGSRILRGYWKRIFAFLEEPQVGKNGSGK